MFHPRKTLSLFTRLTDRTGIILLSVFLNFAGFTLIIPVLPLLICAIALLTFGDGLFQPSASAMIADAAPAGRQGEVQGANQAQQSIARMFGSLASAWLYGILLVHLML